MQTRKAVSFSRKTLVFIYICTVTFIKLFKNRITVKPVLRGHLWDKEKVAF